MKKLFLLFFLMIISLGQSQSLTGTWKVTSLGVGGSQGDIGWWNLSVSSGDRACYFDDTYKFNSNGTFQNIQGSQTWVEGWQGGGDNCGTPIAPHNGSNAATYSATSSSITLTGVGAYLGLAKATNNGEISSPSQAPSSVTYQISSLTTTTLTVDINVGSGWWRFVLDKQPDNAPILSNFSIATRAFGSGSFTLTNPTSTSSGAFTFTSSNTSVATVSGNTVTIIGAGTTTITATQAAYGSYISGSISATLEVTPPAAPTPTYTSTGVISVFSDAYTNVAIDTYRTSWSAGDYTPMVISGTNTIKYSNLSYVGIEATTSPINATSMNLFHIDAWTSNLTTFRVKLVDFGADGSYGGGDDSEHEISLIPTLSGWNSYNLFLSDFTNLAARAHIAQIVLSGAPTGGTVYVDNMYFSNQTFSVAPTYTSFTIGSKPLNTPDFTITPPVSNSPGAFTYTSTNSAVATIINGNMIHIVGTGFTTIRANQAASGNYLAGTISASLIVTAPLATTPIAAAPTPPTRNAWDVVSVYSGAYWDISNTNFFPNWGQGTLYEVVQLAGNNTLHYSNLDYQGINLVPDGSAGINVSTMTKLHLDIWTPNVSPIDISLIAGGENAIVLNPTLSGWNSFDIDLTQYSNAGRTLNNVIQLKLDKPSFAYHAETNSVYIDNIYFWRPTTALPTPTITNFTVANKVLGDAAFTLIAPTSNSTGAFTYTSSNTAVATISGSVVTIVGAGTTIITANQAASSSYGIGNIATNFVVSFPPPSTAAPTPTVPADRVLSLYSNTYSNVTGIDWFPNWGQSTVVSDIQIVGNDTKKYEFLNYQGVQFSNPVDASGMTLLHVDIWTPNCTTFDLNLINTSPATVQQSVTLNPTNTGWNSFDIPLSQYSTISLNSINQLMFVATPSGSTTAYLDNIYFSKPTPTVVAPTVTSVVNLCKGSTATPLTASCHTGNALKWYTVAGTSSAPTYTLITSGAPTPTTTTVSSPSKVYAVSEVYSNGVESLKSKITVNVVALPVATAVSVTSTLTPALTTCSGNSVNLSLAANSQGNIQWQSSTDGTSWVNIGTPYTQTSSTALNPVIPFNTGTLSQTTWFKAVASNTYCSVASVAVKITVSQPTSVGTLSSSTTVCTGTGAILNLSAASGTIAWQKAPVVAGAVGTFAAVAGNTTSTLSTGNLTATTAYRVVVSSGACSTSTSNVVTVTVSPKSTVKTITGAGAICNGGSKTLTLATGSIGSIQWQSNVNSSTTAPAATDSNWTNITGATDPVSYTASPSTTTWYRAVSTSGACSSIASAAVAVTVSQPTSVGTLSSSTTVCTGTGTTLNLDAATGTIAWQKATVVGGVVGTFAAVAGNTTSTLSTGNLTATTAYRVVVSSGACSTSTSNVVTVTVIPKAVAKTISGNTGATTLATAITSCTTTSKVLTYATTGSVGTIQWQYYNGGSSALAPTTSATWTDISGANAATYNAPSLGQIGNVWFRVKVSSSPCSDAFTPSINVWFKACPIIARVEEAPVAAFSAIAYPSPFTENFTLNVTTPSEDKVQVVVYDMIGKLVDQREVSPADAATLEIGDRFPSGVYNVIVTQGDNTKTLRIAKR